MAFVLVLVIPCGNLACKAAGLTVGHATLLKHNVKFRRGRGKGESGLEIRSAKIKRYGLTVNLRTEKESQNQM